MYLKCIYIHVERRLTVDIPKLTSTFYCSEGANPRSEKLITNQWTRESLDSRHDLASACFSVRYEIFRHSKFLLFLQMEAGYIIEFLQKAKNETEKNASTKANDTCWNEFKRMSCKTFVPSCGEETSEITKEICEQKLLW